jgi:hypothetical protein
LTARDRTLRYSEVEHGGGEMLGCVYLAFHAEDLLRPRDLNVVHRRSAKMGESSTESSARGNRQRETACAAVEIKAKFGAPSSNCGNRGLQHLIHVGTLFKDRREPVFYDNSYAEVRASVLQERQCRSGKDAISERTKSNDGERRPGRQFLKHSCHRDVPLLFYFGLVNQHDGDIVADGVYALALRAPETAAIGLQVQRRLVQRAHQDVQQFLADRHV